MLTLTPFEIEGMVESLTPMTMEEIGSAKWMQQAHYLEKLKFQACRDALSRHDELVTDTLLATDQMSVLLHRLITLETWRERVLPGLVVGEITELGSLKVYLLLYQEATLSSILVVALFHPATIESISAHLIELTDYCHRRFVSVNAGIAADEPDFSSSQPGDESIPDRIVRQARSMEFRLASDAISMIRFITDRIEQIPSSVVGRMLNNHDLPGSLISMLDAGRFTYRRDKQIWRFSDQAWYPVESSDQVRLSRLEGNLWISIYNFMSSPVSKQKYNLDDHRKSSILKLKRFFNEPLIDQLPMLAEIWRFVEQLAMSDTNGNAYRDQEGCLLIEQVPDIRESLLQKNFYQIGNDQLLQFFEDGVLRSELKLYADFFGDDDVLDQERCEQCHRPAHSRCSICKTSWFCSRQCQVQLWPVHKKQCVPPAEYP